MKKRILIAVMTALVLKVTISEANALVCAAGVVRAGCVGRHGAVVVGRPVSRIAAHSPQILKLNQREFGGGHEKSYAS
jgi:carbonic anhydrase/acetyltransferase-like protein (isoleucine patch superfamily)